MPQAAKPHSLPDAARNVRPVWEWALLVAGVGLLWFALPHRVHGDGYLRYTALSDLLVRGRLSPMRYSLVTPLLATPFWLLGRLCIGPDWWCARFNVAVFAAGLFALHRLLRRRLDAGVCRKFLLILTAGSMFGGHLREFHGEVLTAMAVAAGLLAVELGKGAGGWAAVAIGVVNTPALIVGLGLATVRRALCTRRARVFLALAAAGALIMGESWLRRGNPFMAGYAQDAGYRTLMPYSGRPGFSYPLFLGLLSIVLSFGKGLVFFAPGLLLGVRARLQRHDQALWSTYVLWLWFLAGAVLVYSKWWSWYGGWFWGPRFFLFASIPASFALAVWLSEPSAGLAGNVWALCVAALSFWVGVNGAVFFLDNLDECKAAGYAFEHLCWYVPEFSVLWRPFVDPRALTAREWTLAGYGAVVFATVSAPLARCALGQAWAAAREFVQRGLRLSDWRW